mgnify:FL=1
MLVNCIPIRQLYNDYISGYRILACTCKGQPPDDLQLNDYGNFTVSGSNLSSLSIGHEIKLDIREDLRSKRAGSYRLVGLGGIKTEGEEIKVDPDQEYNILCGLMSEGQAYNVNSVYPNFIYLVLNGREGEIDYHNIYNVGPVYLEQYIDKVKAACRSILFMPVAMDNGIEDSETIEKLTQVYLTPEELQEAFDTNPYHIYIDLVHYPFKRSDKLVLEKHPEFIDSVERCEYGCMEILRQNEAEGDTRINANLLAALAKELIPEAMGHIIEAVKGCELIHYDEATKYSSYQDTYEAEATIAECIKERLEPDFGKAESHNILNGIKVDGYTHDMNWQDFQEVDGFKMTEEQTKILELATTENVMILTGSGGTGKSTSMKALIRMLEANNRTYTLLAPTGVAAKKLRESTGRDAFTIHMFLARGTLSCGEYIIIDECSMVGVKLMAKLFNKIEPSKSKIVFVCDESQLASIDCGNIVQDILDSGVVPRANLTKVFRYGEGGIATVATDARFGTFTNAMKPYPDFRFIEINEDPIGQILEQYDTYLEQNYTKEDILILSPFNKAPVGTYEVNKAIQSSYNPDPDTSATYKRKAKGEEVTITFKIGDKVLNTHNNYTMFSVEYDDEGNMVDSLSTISVMNGDIGYIRACKNTETCPELIVEFDSGLAKIRGSDIADLILGYAVSIHKIQGAQAKAVIVVIDKSHKNMLTRNLFYVAASRAQQDMTIIADAGAIESGLERQENKERNTWLGDMLKGGVG